MGKLQDISLEDFEAALDSGPQLRTQQLVVLAIGLGPILFAGVVVYVYATTDPMPFEPRSVALLRTMSYVHVAVALGCWTVAVVVPRLLLSPKRIESAMERTIPLPFQGRPLSDPCEIFLARVMQAKILQMALLEGAAVFGLVICLLGAVQGQLHGQPIYWLNTVSTVVLALGLAVTFPARDRIVELFRRTKEEASTAF